MIAAGEEGCLTGLGSLQPFLLSAVEELTASLLRRAISDFNEWLVPLPCPGPAPTLHATTHIFSRRHAFSCALGARCSSSLLSR